jgi:hypothetical protein
VSCLHDESRLTRLRYQVVQMAGINLHWLGKPGGFFLVLLLFLMVWMLLPVETYAGTSKPATKIYNVADTRGMPSGISKWVADAYNGEPIIYGLIVVITMASLGLIIGLIMDRLLKLSGINLGKLEHHE